MIAVRPHERRDGPPDLPPFEDHREHYHVARDEQGVLYHKPACPQWSTMGWCIHLAEAEQRASRPRLSFEYEAMGVLVRWASHAHDREIQAVAGEIACLAVDAMNREKRLRAWQEHEPLEGEALLERGRQALTKYAGRSK